MLAHVKLSKTFWVEALMTVLYVINRLSSVPLDGDIPQRMWTGKDISYRHLSVFSFLAYIHVAKDQRRKLDPKARPCIFLGYGDDEFGYRLWNLAEKKVIRSQDIVFMEEKTIVDWETENKSPTTESSRVDARSNREEVDSIEIECEPVDRFNTRQNRESTEEQREPAERGIESDSDEEVEEEPTLPSEGRRYPLRERRAPRRFPDEEHVLLTDEGEPESFEEAKNNTHSRKWLSAMEEEMDSLHENHTYELIELPRGKKALRNKWVFKLKPGNGGNTPIYKA
mgnify:FL=1